ncbi:34711_t:CDS:2, partial [Gigaspora margarita]
RMDSFGNYEIVSYDLYRGPNALEKFVDKLEVELAEIQADLSSLAEIIMEPGDYIAFNEAIKSKYQLLEYKEWEAYMKKDHPKKKDVQKKYQQALSNLNRKVKDHNHISGKYRGPAHDACNKKLQMGAFKTKVPLIYHNFRGYDSHLLIEVVGRFIFDKLKCIPENIEKYKAMDIIESLDGKLKKFPLTVKYFIEKGYSLDKIRLLLRKGVFLYDWTNLWKKFDRTSLSLPNIQSIAPDAEIGYMPKVDLEVPIHLQDFFADYSLAPKKQIVPKNWLSLYNERLVHNKEVGGGKYTLGEKLLQTLLPKKNYIVHYQALQTYMKFGMKVTKIHGSLKFKQSPWMKDYIEENIRKRKIAKANKEEFEVMYYKLKNNAVFGKQMKNVRKHIRVELLHSNQDKKLKRLVSSPLYIGFKAFEGGVTAVHILKSTVTLNKLIFVGQAILDISKAMMYNFWYGYIKPCYGNKRNPIGESVCLKPKMYSVLPAGHDPNTPKTDEDFKKELEDEETKKSRGIKDW